MNDVFASALLLPFTMSTLHSLDLSNRLARCLFVALPVAGVPQQKRRPLIIDPTQLLSPRHCIVCTVLRHLLHHLV